MRAETVYEVYTALSHEEQNKLYDLVKKHFNSKYNFRKSKKKPLPDFTVEDGIRYLIENVFNKPRNP